MTSRPVTRPLNDRERAIVSAVLGGLRAPDASQLRRQLDSARVTGGLPTFLDLEVDTALDQAERDDGPLPVRSIVTADIGEPMGEVLVWVIGGYLSGLEFAWYTDQAPMELPDPAQISVVAD